MTVMRGICQVAAGIVLASLAWGWAGAAASLTTVDGDQVTGELAGLDMHEVRLVSSGGAKVIKTDDVAQITLRAVAPPGEHTPCALLRNGDALYGKVVGGSEDKVRMQSASLGEVELPITDIVTLHFEACEERRAEERWPVAEREKDEVILANGDSLPGVVVQFRKESLTFDCSLGKVPIPFTRICTVNFAAVGKEYKEPGDLLLVVTCADGSTITGSRARLADDTVSLTCTLGREYAFPLRQASVIRSRNGRLIYLSDLEPVEVKEIPLFDERPWRYQRDASVGGKPLTLRGKVYRKGLGVHSRCELTYDLGGRFKRFLSDVGIDDEVGHRENAGGGPVIEGGNVEVRIYLDGEMVFQELQVKKGSDPVAVDLDVSGRLKLTLVVDFGEELHVNDHVDWADARLIR